jgi:hypothetical protein
MPEPLSTTKALTSPTSAILIENTIEKLKIQRDMVIYKDPLHGHLSSVNLNISYSDQYFSNDRES